MTEARDFHLLSNWRPVCNTFTDDWRHLLQLHIPNLMVDCNQLLAAPSPGDPLASKARMQLSVCTEVYPHLLSLSIDGEASPLLEPHALQTYVIVQWPGLFKMRAV